MDATIACFYIKLVFYKKLFCAKHINILDNIIQGADNITNR